MRWFILFLVSLILSLVGVAVGEEQEFSWESVIESADMNQDGKIDREEYNGRLTEVYYFIDIDKDGNLTLTEIQASVTEVRPERVKAADNNGDGKLSLGEYHNALTKDFDRADKDDDGELSSAEIKNMLEER